MYVSVPIDYFIVIFYHNLGVIDYTILYYIKLYSAVHFASLRGLGYVVRNTTSILINIVETEKKP